MKLLWLILAIPLAAACSPTPTPAATSTAATTGTAPCGTAADTVEQHVQSTKIEAVTVLGQCTLIVIATTLDDEDQATARQICESAAEVAYTDDINAISIKSATGTELSQAISGAPCLP